MTKALLSLMLVLVFFNLQAQNIGLRSTNKTYVAESLVFNSDSQLQSIEFSSVALEQALQHSNTQDKHPLVKVGKTLTFIGVPLLLIGTIMVVNADALYYNCVNGKCEGDPQGGFGVLVLTGGIGATTTGIILWSIGNKKSK